jgi:CAAX protease family protein
MDERLRAPWHPLEAVVLALVAMSTTIILIVLLRLLVPPAGSLQQVVERSIQQVCLAGFTIAWVTVRYRRSLPALGLHSRRGSADGAIGVLAGVVVFLVSAAVLLVQGLVWEAITGSELSDPNQLGDFERTAPVLVAQAILVIGITPVAEEVFFRGFLFGGLRGRLSFLPAAIIASVGFALLHPPVVMLPVFVAGIGFAALYEWRGSLVVSIAAHMAFNLIGYAFIVMSP